MKETLSTMAERLGYSATTISRVLSGKAEKYRISPDTVNAVLREARRCNYSPSVAAQSLRTRRSNTIGLLLPSVANPYFADMASVIDADIYIHSHTHLPMIMKQGFFRIDTANSSIANTTKLFVNTAANLDYGGYGEAQEYKPNSKDTPVIYLSGSKREMTARL